jgi:hypothetical protein
MQGSYLNNYLVVVFTPYFAEEALSLSSRVPSLQPRGMVCDKLNNASRTESPQRKESHARLREVLPLPVLLNLAVLHRSVQAPLPTSNAQCLHSHLDNSGECDKKHPNTQYRAL